MHIFFGFHRLFYGVFIVQFQTFLIVPAIDGHFAHNEGNNQICMYSLNVHSFLYPCCFSCAIHVQFISILQLGLLHIERSPILIVYNYNFQVVMIVFCH
jgi:hypothetical protein